MATRFEWDTHKDRLNRLRHRLGFETAQLVFDDPNAITVLDRIVETEIRWHTIGWVQAFVIIVVHTVDQQSDDEVIRIISARKATPLERKLYEETL